MQSGTLSAHALAPFLILSAGKWEEFWTDPLQFLDLGESEDPAYQRRSHVRKGDGK